MSSSVVWRHPRVVAQVERDEAGAAALPPAGAAGIGPSAGAGMQRIFDAASAPAVDRLDARPPKMRPATSAAPRREEADRVRRFRPERVPAKIDTVVIGSGPGGLVAAGLLVNAGRCVLVLEQHEQAGGCLHEFMRAGVPHHTGLHYGGLKAFGDGQGVKAVLDSISHRKIPWAPMGDPDGAFDRVRFCDDSDPAATEFAVRAGRQRQIEDLVAAFPQEATAIERYFALGAAVQQRSPSFFGGTLAPRLLGRWLGERVGDWLGRGFHELSDRDLDAVVREATDNERLRALLAYAWGDVGGDPRRISFAVDAMVRDHYSQGAAFPVGGPAALAASIVGHVQRRQSSRVLTGARVVAIEIDGAGSVAGVQVQYGGRSVRRTHFVQANSVVSTIGAIQTERLLPSVVRRPEVELPAPSVAHLILFVRFDGVLPRNARSNTWVFARKDYARAVDDFHTAMLGASRGPFAPEWEFPSVFISFPSARDPSWPQRYGEQVHTCQLVAPVPYEIFAPYADADAIPGQRHPDYKELKDRFTNKALEVLQRHFPSVVEQMVWHDLGTPVTSEYYLGSAAGCSYGAETSPQRYRNLACAAPTRVPGLSLGGQDAASPGVAGAAIGGVFAALADSPWTIGWQIRGEITRL